jgi:hypothetical protein
LELVDCVENEKFLVHEYLHNFFFKYIQDLCNKENHKKLCIKHKKIVWNNQDFTQMLWEKIEYLVIIFLQFMIFLILKTKKVEENKKIWKTHEKPTLFLAKFVYNVFHSTFI